MWFRVNVCFPTEVLEYKACPDFTSGMIDVISGYCLPPTKVREYKACPDLFHSKTTQHALYISHSPLFLKRYFITQIRNNYRRQILVDRVMNMIVLVSIEVRLPGNVQYFQGYFTGTYFLVDFVTGGEMDI